MTLAYDISIIIPAKDEALRLPAFLTSVIAHCQASPLRYEIIVVDDGSHDETSRIALNFKNKFAALQVIHLPNNRGKGHAIKRGFFKAQGNIVLFLDADGSTPVTEIEKNLHFFHQGYDIVIGSRVAQSPQASVRTLAYRKWMGIIFNAFVHALLIKDIQDTQCGFKMFRRETIRPIWARVYLDGFGFDLEVLFLAHQLNYKIKETPVNWAHQEGSKINLVLDSLRMLGNIFQIKNWHNTPMNTTDQHMSSIELANMYRQEKDHWWFKAKGEFIKAIIARDKINPRRVLDAGCGTGHNMKFLRSDAYYVGCDVAHEALVFCQHNGSHRLAQCHLERMPFKPGTFDVILSLDVIEHTENPAEVIQQLKQLLANDGLLIITVPAYRFLWSAHDESLSHMRRYTRRDLANLLTDAGLTIKRDGYLFCATFLPVMIIRLIKRLLIKSNAPCDTAKSPSALANCLLHAILTAEARLLGKCPMPFGTSLYAVASNP